LIISIFASPIIFGPSVIKSSEPGAKPSKTICGAKTLTVLVEIRFGFILAIAWVVEENKVFPVEVSCPRLT
jgi:hypothetical protein